MAEVASTTLEAASVSVRAARGFIRNLLADGSDVVDDCELLVSELATNAVLHAATSFRIEVRYGDTTLRVDVIDQSDRLPVVKSYGVEAPTGRGLHIVAKVADRWGVEPSGQGKSVWFEIDHAAAEDVEQT